MVDLQITRRYFFEVDEATAFELLDEGFLDDFGKSRAAFQSSKFCLIEFSEAVCRDLSAIASNYAKCLNRNAMLAHITRRARRMIVAVAILQFLGRDEPVAEDVVNDRFWTLGDDLFAEIEECFGWLCHRVLAIREGGVVRLPEVSD